MVDLWLLFETFDQGNSIYQFFWGENRMENIRSSGIVVNGNGLDRTNVHDLQEWIGLTSVITEDLAQEVDEKVNENRRFTISS